MRTTTAASEPMQSVPVTMDTKGRVRTSKEQRCDILAAFERRGVSAVEFAKENGIKYTTFAGWLQRHRRAKPKGQPSIMRLLGAVVEQTQGGAASSCRRWPCGCRVALKSDLPTQNKSRWWRRSFAPTAMLSFSGSLRCSWQSSRAICAEANGLHNVNGTVGGGPAPGGVVRVHEQAAYAHQDPLLGRHGLMGADQAAGERNFLVA